MKVVSVETRKYLIFSALIMASSPARAEESGLPQLDTSMFPEQIFWLVICFGLLYVMMSFVAMPKIASTQSNRKRVIAEELAAAHAANDTAKTLAARVEKSLIEAHEKAHAHVVSILAEVSQENAAHMAAEERETMQLFHRAESDIAVAREAALNAMRANVPELAQLIVENTSGVKMRANA